MKDLFTIAQTAVANTQAAANTAANTAAANAPAAQQPSFTEGLGGMLPFIIVIAAMFFLMWRGQSKERKRREEMLNSIMAGTRVMTAGGFYGVVQSVSGDIYKLKIADNVTIEMNRAGIASVIKEETSAAPAEEKK